MATKNQIIELMTEMGVEDINASLKKDELLAIAREFAEANEIDFEASLASLEEPNAGDETEPTEDAPVANPKEVFTMIAISPVKRNGQIYKTGEKFTVTTKKEIDALAGSAELA